MIRIFDLVFSILGLIFLSPLFLVISVFIVIESSGGVLFSQVRVGQNGLHFRLYKFRTMKRSDFESISLTVHNDRRITRVGKVLRSYKLDELPQLYNVLKGEMSIVGPRPEVPEFVKYYTEEQKVILSIKPGITDLASIEFSDESALLTGSSDPKQYYISHIMPQKIVLNTYYLQNRNISNYFKIILKTITVLFK